AGTLVGKGECRCFAEEGRPHLVARILGGVSLRSALSSSSSSSSSSLSSPKGLCVMPSHKRQACLRRWLLYAVPAPAPPAAPPSALAKGEEVWMQNARPATQRDAGCGVGRRTKRRATRDVRLCTLPLPRG
ncbi:unnamed protein product, partial [Scytosiphon promiscuus]